MFQYLRTSFKLTSCEAFVKRIKAILLLRTKSVFRASSFPTLGAEFQFKAARVHAVIYVRRVFITITVQERKPLFEHHKPKAA